MLGGHRALADVQRASDEGRVVDHRSFGQHGQRKRQKEEPCDDHRRHQHRSGDERTPRPGRDRDAAGGNRNWVDVARIIVLSVQQNHREHQQHVRVSEKAGRGLAQQCDQSDDPNRRKEEIREQELLKQIERRAGDDVLAARAVAQELDHRETVQGLPQNVWCGDRDRDRRTRKNHFDASTRR